VGPESFSNQTPKSVVCLIESFDLVFPSSEGDISVKENKALDSGAKEDIHLEADIFFGNDSRTICELEYLQEKVKKFFLLVPTVSVGTHIKDIILNRRLLSTPYKWRYRQVS